MYNDKQKWFNSTEKQSLHSNQHGFIRSEGKWYTFQNYTYGTNVGVKRDTQCQKEAWHPWVKVYTYQRCWCEVICVSLYLLVIRRECGPLWEADAKVLLEMEGREVLQDLIPKVGQLKLASVPVKGWLLALMYTASLMVMVMLSASIPMMEKVPTLMKWPYMLPWS